MFVETVFWFHPLVWWIGKRMVEERERACDEEVLRLGSEPQVYAEGILNVCKLYMESPLACVSGVTGANLKKRIEAIMSNRAVVQIELRKESSAGSCRRWRLSRRLIVVGMMNAPYIRAQSATAPTPRPPKFEVASITRCKTTNPVGSMGGGDSSPGG